MIHTDNNRTVNVNNLGISYTDENTSMAQSIIFIHGFPLNKSMWENQAKNLKETHRVITYDIRGHGNTNNGGEKYSIELFVNDLIGLMDALNIEKTILCGLSMGGYIALKAITEYPNRFKAVILCDTNCTADSPETIANRKRNVEIIETGTVGKYADESLKKFFTANSLTENKTIAELVRDMIIETSKSSICKTLLALAEREETCSKLIGIKVPALILVGREDQVTPPDAAKLMHESIKSSTLHIIEHAGHLSNLEQPVEFNDQLKKFLSSIKH